jgi:hypothetical protein
MSASESLGYALIVDMVAKARAATCKNFMMDNVFSKSGIFFKRMYGLRKSVVGDDVDDGEGKSIVMLRIVFIYYKSCCDIVLTFSKGWLYVLGCDNNRACCAYHTA